MSFREIDSNWSSDLIFTLLARLTPTHLFQLNTCISYSHVKGRPHFERSNSMLFIIYKVKKPLKLEGY